MSDSLIKIAQEAAKRVEQELMAAKAPVKKAKKAKTKDIDSKAVIISDKSIPPPKTIKIEKVTPQADMNEQLNVQFMERVKTTGLKLDEKQEKALLNGFAAFKSTINYAGIVRRCPGSPIDKDAKKCEHFAICPFRELDDSTAFPIGQLCPVEMLIADKEMAEYIRTLGIPNDKVPMAILNQLYNLIECDINEMRMRNAIQAKGFTRAVPAFAVNKTGEVIMKDEVALEVEILDRVQRRKDVIMKNLMFTPEIRMKHKVVEGTEKELSPVEAAKMAHAKLLEHKKKTTEG